MTMTTTSRPENSFVCPNPDICHVTWHYTGTTCLAMSSNDQSSNAATPVGLPPSDADIDDPADKVFQIHPSRLDDLKKTIDKANRRLERAGIEERFEVELGDPVIESRQINGTTVYLEHIPATINTPEIGYNGWTFTGKVDIQPGGSILSAAPGQSENLEGFDRPDDNYCQHCGKRRSRKASYILTNRNGQQCQVGSNCLQNFLGVKPQLWVMEYEKEFNEGFGGGGGGIRDYRFDNKELLGLAMALSNGGEDFVSRKSVQEYGSNSVATADEVMGVYDALHNPRAPKDVRARAQQLLERAREFSDADYDDIKSEIERSVRPGGYRDNLEVLFNQPNTSYKHVATLASAVGVASRAKRQRRADEAAAKARQDRDAAIMLPIASGYAAPVNTRGLKMPDVRVLRAFETQGDYGPITTVIMQDREGHMMKWTANNKTKEELREAGLLPEEAGSKHVVNITGGSVKGNSPYHDNYRDITYDQTTLQRVKFEPVPSD